MPITMSGCRIVELLTVHSLPADYLPSSATAVARLSAYRSSIYSPAAGLADVHIVPGGPFPPEGVASAVAQKIRHSHRLD